ncbi:MAG: hypothetical protein KatS3mg014_2512 [Actinomycetota bacterium]|nr:MAG: hypothetical protein KatS3mg014_2493 [Actinomycetota bacterium]GIV00897.1 MAG: hypothetical protein KatS3mg014_2512 [Actinomycetota bacterium]
MKRRDHVGEDGEDVPGLGGVVEGAAGGGIPEAQHDHVLAADLEEVDPLGGGGHPIVQHAHHGLTLALLEALGLTVRATERPTAGNGIRHSMAGTCGRAASWWLQGVVPTDPPDEASEWSMWVGSRLHDALAADLAAHLAPVLGTCEPEAPVLTAVSSGHVDLWFPEARAAVELKTMGQAAFDIACGIWRGAGRTSPRRREGRGPDVRHVLQAVLNAHALGARVAALVYLAVDPVPRGVADALGLEDWERFAAIWTWSAEEFAPWAEAELRRFGRILAGDDSPRWPVDVSGALSAEGPVEGWPCGWCGWRSLCYQESEMQEVSEPW